MSFRTLDLNLLRVFDVVMVERNVTRAASALAITQPAVSNALRRLREAIGEDLFVPGSTGVAPTPHALALWPAVREALGGLRELFEPPSFDPRRDERAFTLAMADATAAVVLPPLIERLQRERARVDLRIEPLTTRDPRAALERGAADGAIGFFPDVARTLASAAGQADSMLDALYGCEYICVMNRHHPLAKLATLTLDDYCAAQHVRVSFAGRAHGFVDEALARLGRARRVALTVNQFSNAARVVRRSQLLSVFPRSFVPASGEASGLAVRELPFEMPRIEVGLLWHRRHERDDAHRWLRDAVFAATAGFRTGSSAAPSAAPTPART
jgi:DNA-binding transcriptional LysR family regulator